MDSSETEAVFAAIRAAEPEGMARDELAAHSSRLRRLRSWLESEEVRAARRARTLEREGRSESAESMATRSGGRSGRAARDLAARSEICDEMPGIEAALSAGDISSDHVDAVARAARGLDDEARREFTELASDIADEAARSTVDAFDRSVRDLAASITARRQSQSDVDELEAQRTASKVRRWIDKRSGMHHTHLELDPVRDAKLNSAISAELARLRTAEASSTASWDQLLVDAFVGAVGGSTLRGSSVNRPAASSQNGSGSRDDTCSGRVDRVPEITVLIDFEKLLAGASAAGICETENGVPLPVATVRRLCCDAEVLPTVLGTDGAVLDAGRSVRTATRQQRRALRAMHRGCAHPDCTVGFDACRIHHVRWWWEHEGRTDLDNLLPLCERHHHLVHEGGWILTMTADRVATWRRPDGVVYHRGSTIDRTPGSPLEGEPDRSGEPVPQM